MKEAVFVKEKKLDQLMSRFISGMMLAIAVYALFLLWGDVQGVLHVLARIPVSVFALAILCTLSSYFIRFTKWHWMLKQLDIHLPLRQSLDIFFIGLSMSITPGKMGELLKSYLIKKQCQIDISRSASAVFVDRLTDLFSMLVLISVGITLFKQGWLSFILFVAILLGITLLLRWQTGSLKLIDWMTSFTFLQKYREPARNLYQNIYALLQGKVFIFSVLISVAAWFMECVSLYVFTQSLGISLSLIHDIFIFSFGTLAGALSMLPGGLGIAEGSIAGLYMHFHIDKSTAVSITFLIRLVTLWLGVWIGLAVFLRKRNKYLLS
jgi:uncharacterized protein (TIRG00374 family)